MSSALALASSAFGQVHAARVVGVPRVASLGIWPVFSRTRTPWRSMRCGSRPGRAPRRPVSNNGRTGGGGGQVPDRAVARHGAATAGRSGGGQAISDELENSRIRPMLVARSALSGITGTNPFIRFAPCLPVARRAGTALALFLVSGTSATRYASTRVVRPSVAARGVSLGFPAVCLIRAPVVSAGMLLERPLMQLHPLIQLGSCWGPRGGHFPMICMVGKPCPGRRSRRLFAQMGCVGADRRCSPDPGQAAFTGVRGEC